MKVLMAHEIPMKAHSKTHESVQLTLTQKSRLFHGPLTVNFSKYFHGFFNGIFIDYTHENTLSFGNENLVNKA